MNTKALVISVIGIAVLGGLFVWLQPGPNTPEALPVQPAPTIAAPVPPPKPIPVERTVELTLEKGKRVSGPETIQATQGEVLELRVVSDSKDELHVHGYDFKADLVAGESLELRFPLTHAGRFEIELHGTHSVVTVLEVQPN